MQRHKGKHVSKILCDCPDIGKSIEEFVKDNNVGADAWRRTGVLTFDGNRKRNKKVTFTQARFRLDTLATHSKHPVLTTNTDYVNSYNSTLQTTSYNFTETANTGEMCAGVVKAVQIHHKNPAQHAKDLEDIEKIPEFRHVFTNPDTMLSKTIECIRVDGGND